MSNIEEFLESKDFVKDTRGNSEVMFFKRSPAEVTHCECNEAPPIIRVYVYKEIVFPNGNVVPVSVEVKTFGEAKGLWFTGKTCMPSEEFMKRSEEVIKAMTATWEAFALSMKG